MFPAAGALEGRAEMFGKEADEALGPRERKPRSAWVQEERMMVGQGDLHLGHGSRITIIHSLMI